MAVEPGDVNFVSKLDEASKKKAKDELNELNDKDRALAVQAFREWILQQKWLKTPTDFGFLLRFLRARKFSQLEARKTIENYWTCRTQSPEWYRNIDPEDPVTLEVIRSGFYVVPKQLDKYGRRVIFERLAGLDVDKVKKVWGINNLYKAIMLICDWANFDENIQVNGHVIVSDCTGLSLNSMMTLMDGERDKKLMNYYQNALPARMKGIHIYNEPTYFDAIMALVLPFMKKKFKDRMKLHGRNLTTIFDEIGMEAFPNVYLPDDYNGVSAGSIDDIVEDMIADMMRPEFKEHIKSLSSDQYGVDLQLRKQDDAPVASFRKLNVD
ncbi:hypothetical protein ACF0H5_012391 [Mactra antiquata]